MNKLEEFYRKNIYGIIATLVFHLLLFIALLWGQLRYKYYPQEDNIEIELIQPEEIKEEIAKEEEKAENSEMQNQSQDQLSNRAVNTAEKREETKDPFFDKSYQQEIEEAQQLSQKVSNNLSKEIPQSGGDIKMPEETVEEGKDPQKVSHTIYKGKSNIHYHLENRYHTSLKIPVYMAYQGGEIVVDIVVNRDGYVIEASVRKKRSLNPSLINFAENAAKKSRFNTSTNAPEKQKGTITYNFVSQ